MCLCGHCSQYPSRVTRCCVCVYAHASGRFYLGRVNIVQHYYGCAVVVQHQSPEILHSVWQRVLGHYESRRLLVTLQDREGNKGIKTTIREAVASLHTV